MGVPFPRDRMERLKREYGERTVEALYAEFERIELEDNDVDAPQYIECVYDTKSRSLHPVVTGTRGGKYFYHITEGRKYIKERQIEMVNPDTTPIVDLNPALKITEVVPKTY